MSLFFILNIQVFCIRKKVFLSLKVSMSLLSAITKRIVLDLLTLLLKAILYYICHKWFFIIYVIIFIGKPLNSTIPANPFSDVQSQQRPVFNPPPPKPSINEMKQASIAPFTSPAVSSVYPTLAGATPTPISAIQQVQDPWTPAAPSNNQLGAPWMKSSEAANPFLS